MKKILSLYLLLCSVHVFAQNYSITNINISMPASPDANTANWGQGASPFTISARTTLDSNRQVQGYVVESQILVTIKKGGSKICGSYTATSAPASSFNTAVKVWNGRNAVSLLGQDCVLPPGDYELCVQFFGSYNGREKAFSEEKCKSFTVRGAAATNEITYQPPQNVSPANGTILTEIDVKKPVTFRWTSVVPKPQEAVVYKLKVWQLMQGQNGTTAMKANTPLFEKEIENATQAILNMTDWKCGVPCEYVWNVEAANKDVVQGNNKIYGVSETATFSISSTGVVSTCDCGDWELFTVNGKNYTCGQKIDWKCNNKIDFSARYNCKPNDGSCIARIEGEIKKDGVLFINFSSGPHPYIDHGVFTPTTNGVYTINLYPTCNGKVCPPCTLTLTVSDCGTPSICDCKTTQCKKKLWYESAGTATKTDLTCNAQTPVVLNCDLNYHFFADTKCSPDSNCKMTIKGELRNAVGTVVIQQAAFSKATFFNIISTTPGNYTFIIKYYINDVECSQCFIPITIGCNPPAGCCKNGDWYNKNWYTGGPLINQSGVGRIPVPLPPSGTNLGAWLCSVPSYAFHCSFACANNCTALINYSIYSINTGALISTETVQSAAYASLPAITINGNYQLVISAICGQDTCDNKLTYPFEIKCNQPINCCLNSNWGDRIMITKGGITGGDVPRPLPACKANLGLFDCKAIKAFKVFYNCAKECGPAQLTYQAYDAATNVANGTAVIVAPGAIANVTAPGVSGNWYIKISARCGNNICDSCMYFFETKCSENSDCCKGSKWTNKSLDWDVKIKVQQGDATELSNEPAQKRTASKQKNQKSAASIKKIPVDVNVGQSNPLKGSLKVEKCGDTLKTTQGGEFNLNAAYTCNTALSNCKGKVIAKVKDPSGITYGTWPLPHLFNFTTAGIYTVSYYAYCGEPVCDSCTFFVNAEKDCCKGSQWIKADYQIVNKKQNGDPDRGDGAFYTLPTTLSTVPTYKADLAVDVENLNYQCAATQGCNTGYIIRRKNLTTGALVEPDETLPAGQVSTSIYTKPFPQIITVTPTCGGKVCGKPIIFKVECLSKNCTPPVPCNNCDSTGNLVANGYFSSGNTRFTSDIPYNVGWNNYADKYDLIPYSGTTPQFNDATSGSAYGGSSMLYIRSIYNHTGQLMNKILWKNAIPIAVKNGSSYSFCFKMAEWYTTQYKFPVGFPSHAGDPELEFDVYINAALFMPNVKFSSWTDNDVYATKNRTTGWIQFQKTWIATSSTATIEIRCKNKIYPEKSGWHFGLDDIILKECGNTPVSNENSPCCKGSSWINKLISWSSVIDKYAQQPAQKSNNKTPQVKNADINAGPANTLSTSINITRCDSVYHLSQNGAYTLSANYQCANVSGQSCTKLVKVKIKGPGNNSLDGIYNSPITKTFFAAGNYTITYYTYCGDKICDSCTYTLTIDKNCCLGSRWNKADYQVVNKKLNGDLIYEPTFNPLPIVIGSYIPIYKADAAINVEHLDYECMDDGECNAGYIIRRKNLTTGALVEPDETLPAGQVSTSIYTKPFPQLITITSTCGGKVCGKPIIFKVECLSKDCLPKCINDTIAFSTGISLSGTVATGTEPQWYAPYTLKILSPGVIPFFGTSGTDGGATILQNNMRPDTISHYTASRNISVSKNCTINFSGKLGISRWNDTTWATLFKSFKLHQGSTTGPVVWTYVSGTPGSVGTYVTNNFNGTIAVTPGVYSFVFEYNKASSLEWQKNAMFVTGIIVRNILPTSKECCPVLSETGEPGVIVNKGVSFAYYCKCCKKTVEFTSGAGAVAHQKSCCATSAPTTTTTVGKIGRMESDSTDTNTNNENPNANKGWDGKIMGGNITFPPNAFAIFCPTGTIGLDGKCVPIVTILDGSYAISDGMLNGKKELMNSEEVNNAIGRKVQNASNLAFKGAIIKNANGELNVVAVYYNKSDNTIQTVLVPLLSENGYLKMQSTSTLITQVGDKQTTSKGPTISSSKSDYVGHVTLLR